MLKGVAWRISTTIRRLSAQPGHTFMLSDGLVDELDAASLSAAEVISLDTESVTAVETLDPGFVHAFWRECYHLTREFSWHGVSLLEICGLRWQAHALEEFGLALAVRRQQLMRKDCMLQLHGIGNAGLALLLPGVGADAWRQWLGRGIERIKTAQFKAFLGRIAKLNRQTTTGADRSAMAHQRGKTLLVVSNFDRTLERLLQILPDIQARFGCHIHVLRAKPSAAYGSDARFDALEFSYLADWIEADELAADHAALRRQGQNLRRRLDAVAHQLRHHALDGVAFFDASRSRIDAVLQDGGEAGLMAMQAAARAIDVLKPFMVLNFEDWELNRAATIFAQRRNIPTLAYYCLTPSWHSDVLFPRSQENMAVVGAQLEMIFSRQYAASHLRVVGDPVSDALMDEGQRLELRQKVRQKFGVKPGEKLILLLANYAFPGFSKSNLITVFRKTAECVNSLPATRLLVKAHPAQSIVQLKDWLLQAGVDADVVQEGNVFDYCCAADLISATISSSTTQALLARVPVVCFVSRRALELYELRGNDYLAGGGVRCLDGEADYVAQVKTLLADTAEREQQIENGMRYAARHVGGAERKSGTALVDFMADIVGDTQSEPKRMVNTDRFGAR